MSNQDTWKDIDINFDMQRNGDLKADYHIDAIKNSLINILQTMPSWRRMLPEFANNLWFLLFEPMDEETANEIGERILGVIEEWDDRIEIENVHVDANYNYQQYSVRLTFRLKNYRSDPENLETITAILRSDSIQIEE